MVVTAEGSIASAVVLSVGAESEIGVHVTPASADRHTPPPSLPRYIIDGSIGSKAIALTLPDQFWRPKFVSYWAGFGPIDLQRSAEPAGAGAARVAVPGVRASSLDSAKDRPNF